MTRRAIQSRVVTVETYKPSPKQQKFHADPAKYRLTLGAFGAGKTTVSNWEGIQTAIDFPGSCGVIFRKTYPALRDTTQRDFLEACPLELIKHRVKTEGREEVELVNGSRVLFRCLDDWRKLGSTKFDWIAVDEAWEIDEDTFRILRGRLRGTVGPRRLWMATNPPNTSHWLYKFFVQDAHEDFANRTVHSFSTYDNAVNLPEGYIKDLEKYPESWRKRFLEGTWGFLAEGTAVYGEFRESLHVADLSPIPGTPLLRGWDPGYAHPACVWGQLLPSGHAIIVRELQGENEEIDVFVRRVVQITQDQYPRWCGPTSMTDGLIIDYCDVAGTQKHNLKISAVQVMQQHGVHPRMRRLAIDRSVLGIRYLIGRIHQGTPMLRVDRKCRLTIEAFLGGYVMDDRPGHEGEPKKDNFHDHLMDATRYMLAPAAMPMLAQADRALPARPRVAV